MSDPNPNKLQVEIVQDGHRATVYCFGRLVAGVANDLYTQVRPLVPETRHITLDLSGLDYADSMGLGALVRLYVSAKGRGTEISLINVGDRVRTVLGVTGLLPVFAGELA